jgi:alpha-tubulin suppressor-like RCC1 family protein
MTVTIDKAALISQVQTIVANLNLSTDKSQRLALFYKIADNISAPTVDIRPTLLTRLETVSSSESLEELLMLIVATSLITKDRSLVVDDLSVLDTLTNIEPGSIYFVEDVGAPYIKKLNGTWTTIDPSLSPNLPLENAWAWGNNVDGQLGDNDTTNRSSPVSVVGGFSDWISASASYHSLGVRANGSLWAWGRNSFGQLGDDTITDRSSPVSVVGGFSDWVSASAGGSHSLGVRANGSLWAWGNNGQGRLGDDTITSRSSPVSVVGGFSDWISASAAGGSHSLGVRANGSLWAWGVNSGGQLGDNTITSRTSPVSVVGGFSDWISASAGGGHNLGVRANGSLWAWGSNSDGRLGDNSTTSRLSPVSVVGGFSDWISASAGGSHSLGVRANGTVWTWGSNSIGRLGDNTLVSRSSPVSVVGGFTDWISASGGGNHSVAVRANGTVWAWGDNFRGGLGAGTTTTRSSPVSVVGGFTDWISASAGSNHSLGVRGG